MSAGRGAAKSGLYTRTGIAPGTRMFLARATDSGSPLKSVSPSADKRRASATGKVSIAGPPRASIAASTARTSGSRRGSVMWCKDSTRCYKLGGSARNLVFCRGMQKHEATLSSYHFKRASEGLIHVLNEGSYVMGEYNERSG